jgi:hypothetical protein
MGMCALINVCQAMHVIYMRQEGDALGMYPASLLNPAELCCTCKGFRVSCNCSHTVAVTAMYLKEEHCVPGRRPFDAAFLEALLEKLPTSCPPRDVEATGPWGSAPATASSQRPI